MSIRTEPSSHPAVDRGRFAYAGWLMFGMFGLAAFSQTKLQIFERDTTTDLAKKQGKYIVTRVERAKRGSILDREGNALAKDEDSYELSLSYKDCPGLDGFYVDLSSASGIPAAELQPAPGEDRKIWKSSVNSRQAEAIKRVKVAWRADGVSLDRAGHRSYPLEEAASGIVGLVRDGTPLAGMEYSQRTVLHGRNGSQTGLTDRQGAFLPMRLETAKKAVNGKDITLTLDRDLQIAASTAIRAAVEQNKAEDGVAIIMNPQNGDILAMANWPTFSPTRGDGSAGDLRKNSGMNPAYMSVLEPGSTFKILTLAKALDSGKLHMSDHETCRGSLLVTKHARIHCDPHHGRADHGWIDPNTAIEKSCNVSAAHWALSVGRPEFVAYIKQLGLLKPTKLGLTQECAGLLNENEYAKQLQLATLGFGQSISCTPIGLASAFCMIGNGGVRREPRLINKIGGELQPRPLGTQIVKSETAGLVMKCMESVIQKDEGTGAKLRIPGYVLAGKTGTAEKKGRGMTGFVSNFVGFVPAQSPQAMILVMVNHPQAGQYYGAAVAGPVFHELAQAVIQRYGIAPTKDVNKDRSRAITSIEAVNQAHR